MRAWARAPRTRSSAGAGGSKTCRRLSAGLLNRKRARARTEVAGMEHGHLGLPRRRAIRWYEGGFVGSPSPFRCLGQDLEPGEEEEVALVHGPFRCNRTPPGH